jgi:broad specificity phosphatase PhoE
VGEALAGEPIAAVYSSHLQRAAETGRQIGKHRGLTPTVLEELREIEVFRDLPEGKSIRDVVPQTTQLGMQARFIRERRWDVYPYSESSAEFRHRIVTAIEGILALHPAETIAVACHGGVINTYVGHQLGLHEDMFFRPGHASVSRILAGDGGRRVVLSLNEVHHLAAVDAALVTC